MSDGAYNLFYRLRDHCNLEKIDFDVFHQQASPEFIKLLKEHEAAKAAKKK